MKSIIVKFLFIATPELLYYFIYFTTLPLYTNLLTESQFGALPLLNSFWLLVGSIQFLGMDWALPYFLAHPENTNKENIFSTSTIFAFAMVILMWIIFSFWLILSGYGPQKANLTEIEVLLYLLALLPNALIYWELYILRFALKFEKFVLLNILYKNLTFLSLPFLPLVEQSKRLFLILIFNFVFMWFCFNLGLFLVKKELNIKIKYFSSSLLKRMLIYGLFLLPAGIAYYLFFNLDRILVSYFFDSTSMAIYFIVANVTTFIYTLKGFFLRIFDPIIIHLINQGTIEKIKNYIGSIFFLMLNLMFFLLLNVSLIINQIIELFLPFSYHEIAKLIPIVMLAGIFSTLSSFFAISVYLLKIKKIQFILNTSVFLISLFFGLLMIPKYKLLAASCILLIGEFLIFILWYIIEKNYFKQLNIDLNFNFYFSLLLIMLIYFIIFHKFLLILSNLIIIFAYLFFILNLIKIYLKLKENYKIFKNILSLDFLKYRL